MINPIQQNVVFKGNDALQAGSGFTGNLNAAGFQRSVRGDYANTVTNVLDMQQTESKKLDSTTGNKLDTIA